MACMPSRWRRCSTALLWRIAYLAHGLPAHFDAVGVVNQPVQDAIGDGGGADSHNCRCLVRSVFGNILPTLLGRKECLTT